MREAGTPASRQYRVWHEQRLFELWRLWDKTIRDINAQACFIANSGGGALSELDMATIGEMAPILFADKQARRGVMPPWGNGKNGKEYRSAMGKKPRRPWYSPPIDVVSDMVASVHEGRPIYSLEAELFPQPLAAARHIQITAGRRRTAAFGGNKAVHRPKAFLLIAV